MAEIIYYFTIYSFLGWLAEVIILSIRRKRFINRGFLNGPFCPIYGFGGVATILFSQIPGIGPAAVFFFGLVGLTAMEYATSFFMEKLFGARWWSYERALLNIRGRVALFPALIWGISAVVFVYAAHPNIVVLVNGLTLPDFAAYAAVVYFLIDFIFSLRSAFGLSVHISKIKNKEEADAIITSLSFGERRMARAFPKFISDAINKWSTSKMAARNKIEDKLIP